VWWEVKQKDVLWLVVWPDGTRCSLDHLEEYLVFMDDDFEVVAIHDGEEHTQQLH